MPNRLFTAAFGATSQHRRLTLSLAAAATILGLATLWLVPLDNDIALMLPEDVEVTRSMSFLQNSNLSGKVILSLEIAPNAGGLDQLLTAVEQLEATLGPPLVTGTESGVSGESMTAEFRDLLGRAPQLLHETDLLQIDAQLTPDGVNEILRRNYRQLIGPGEMFAKETIRRDPLGLSGHLLGVVQDLTSSIGYRVEIEDGHFVSADRRHALLLVETPIKITDAAGGRQLFEYLRQSLAELPNGVTADIVAGHLHTISNEDVIQHDVVVGLGAASVGFLILFLWLYRDPRAIAIFLLPVSSVIIAIGLAGLTAGRLSAFVVGMGGVVAGIAIDYAIHVYMAIRAARGDIQAVRLVAAPIVTGALTTLSVFIAFLFSTVSGYRQLALFSISSIAICVLFSLFVLPLIVGGSRKVFDGAGSLPKVTKFSRPVGSMVIAVWLAAMVGGVLSLGALDIRTDLRQFDGSEPYVMDAEERFERLWAGDGQPAILVASGATLEEALFQNSRLYEETVVAMGADRFASLAPVWPPRQERIENAATWKQFWENGREAYLRRLLSDLGPRYDFAPSAFDPFLERLSGDIPLEEFDSRPFPTLAERFTRQLDDGYQVFSFFPDDPEWTGPMREIVRDHPGAFVVSQSSLADALAQSISNEVRRLAVIAIFLLPGLAFLLLRSARLTAFSLIPVASSLLAVLAVPSVVGWSLTAPAMIAAMIVVGLSIDYGIFIVHACTSRENTETTAAVTLSAVSTLIGTGALVLSQHPVLFSVGITMVTGITAAYGSAVLVVPALYERVVGPVETR